MKSSHAVSRVREPGISLQPVLDRLPVGAYLCDAAGLITYYNPRAVELWGRAPRLNDPVDRWCGSFKLYLPDGTPIAHDQCWMARAIREERDFTGEEILIERPDGSRVHGLAHASPLRDERGRLIGAVNVLVDVSDRRLADEARARLAAIVESSHDAIISKTLDGIVTSWNQAAERLFGYTAREMIGQPILRLIPPERHSEETDILARLRRGERVESYETQRQRKDGTLVDVSLTISPVRDAAGRIIGASKIARDIGLRKSAERTLRQSEQRYRSLVEASGAIVFHSDQDANWVDRNPDWEAYTGQSHDEYRGLGWAEAVHPEDRPVVIGTMRDAIARGTTFDAHGRVWHAPSRSWRHQEARAVPIRDPAGRITAWVGTCLDVHARREAEEALRAADRRKDEFLAVMAHELRNPLAPMANSLEVLDLGSPDPGAQRELLGIVRRQVGTMVRLVDDLMEASRIGRGLIELKLEHVALRDVVEAAAEIARPLFESRNHRLDLSEVDGGLVVHGDRTRLTQVVANLLNNAGKYTAREGNVTVRAQREGPFAVLSVRDNGCGIPQHMLASIFEMFTQVDTSLERTQGGLGIGLSIVKRLVELHGGTVEARSEGRNRGSTFTVRLPAAKTRAESAADGILAYPPRHRVLIADDNQDAALSLAMLLRTLNQEVHVVHNGTAALAQAEKLRPDVVLLDIGMPGLNGYDVARRLRAEAWGRDLLICAMTGWGQEEDRRRSREAGFDHHMVKPASLDALCRVLLQAKINRDAPL